MQKSYEEQIAELHETLKLQAAIYQTEQTAAVATAITAMRVKLLHELDNIQFWANRDEPNISAIIRKTQELKTFLQNYCFVQNHHHHQHHANIPTCSRF